MKACVASTLHSHHNSANLTGALLLLEHDLCSFLGGQIPGFNVLKMSTAGKKQLPWSTVPSVFMVFFMADPSMLIFVMVEMPSVLGEMQAGGLPNKPALSLGQ